MLILLPLTFHSDGVHGHGIGSETFPPTPLDGRQVTLEVSSSQNESETDDDLQISVAFIDFDSKITLRDVTFHIKSERGEQFLFEREFQADNGFLVFNFIPQDADSIIIEEADGGLFELLGLQSRTIDIKGPGLNEGGLYTFDVSILTAGGYSEKLDMPLVYNAGISIPQTASHEIHHPDFGLQTIDTVTYYDTLSDFDYDIGSKKISFSMPFEWTRANIERIPVVHQELVIPKALGDLLVSGYSIHVNGIKLSDDIVTIDDFFADLRVVHFIINQQEIWNVFESNGQEGMNFVITPSLEETQLSSVTHNGQFKILASWEPGRLKSNSEATVYFTILDPFFKNRPIPVEYDFSVAQNGVMVYRQSGISTDLEDSYTAAKFMIPQGMEGIIYLHFDNLADNPNANASLPVVVNSAVPDKVPLIPPWIKDSAAWWAEGAIGDEAFLGGIEFLIKNNILVLPPVPASAPSGEIPPWIKDSAAWWAEGAIGDEAFLQSLQFLIGQGILQV